MFIILYAYTCHLFVPDINITGKTKRRVYQISIVIFHFFWYENAGITIRRKRL